MISVPRLLPPLDMEVAVAILGVASWTRMMLGPPLRHRLRMDGSVLPRQSGAHHRRIPGQVQMVIPSIVLLQVVNLASRADVVCCYWQKNHLHPSYVAVLIITVT